MLEAIGGGGRTANAPDHCGCSLIVALKKATLAACNTTQPQPAPGTSSSSYARDHHAGASRQHQPRSHALRARRPARPPGPLLVFESGPARVLRQAKNKKQASSNERTMIGGGSSGRARGSGHAAPPPPPPGGEQPVAQRARRPPSPAPARPAPTHHHQRAHSSGAGVGGGYLISPLKIFNLPVN